MLNNYQLAVHWPHLQRLELHLPGGVVHEIVGASIAIALNTLRQNAVPVLYMPIGESWRHTDQHEMNYNLHLRQN